MPYVPRWPLRFASNLHFQIFRPWSEQRSTDHTCCLANGEFSDHFMSTYFIVHEVNSYELQIPRQIRVHWTCRYCELFFFHNGIRVILNKVSGIASAIQTPQKSRYHIFSVNFSNQRTSLLQIWHHTWGCYWMESGSISSFPKKLNHAEN